ncbi:hypothetical protein CP02DC16_0266B, partial [Chlamydia psittaci 02DC16]
PDLGAK